VQADSLCPTAGYERYVFPYVGCQNVIIKQVFPCAESAMCGDTPPYDHIFEGFVFGDSL